VTVAALTVLSLMWWGHWLMLRVARPPQAGTPAAALTREATRTASALGLEDDPDQWPAIHGAWTGLDERQLLRLLTDSSPVDRPSTNITGDTVAHGEQEDTP
jgi:hypothetical protein